jgi:hypothetical protein
MHTITRFLLRILLIVAGLVFAASLMVLMIVLLLLWCIRALWCKLTGQPVNPFAMRMGPRAGFDRFYGAKSTPRVRPREADVTDVEARDVKN